jgi:plasmid maintenance system antidote protein VapI
MGYKKLRKKFTPEELADAFVFPVKLTAKQKKEEAELLAIARKAGMTDETKFNLNAVGIKHGIEDALKEKTFDPDHTFGLFLKWYIDILEKKINEFAAEISIEESLLTQLLNDQLLPPDYIAIRLELHSGNRIPATHWLRLVEKQRLLEIENNKEIRQNEAQFVQVHFPLNKSA